MSVAVTIVRHGNTFEADEASRRIGGRTDLPLVASGRRQALLLGDCFQKEGIRFDMVLSAPLRRTLETATYVMCAQPALQVVIERSEWLVEIDHGPDENQTEPAVLARIGADALARWDRQGEAPDGWIVDRAARIAAWRLFFQSIGKQPALRHVLVVTSSGMARFALMANDRLRKQARNLPELKMRTGAWSRIAIDGGSAVLCDWDRRPS